MSFHTAYGQTRVACQDAGMLMVGWLNLSPWMAGALSQFRVLIWLEVTQKEWQKASRVPSPPTVPAGQPQLECLLMYLAESSQLRTETWEFSTQPWQTAVERSKASGSGISFLVFRLSDWEGDFKLFFFFPLSFSFIVITKYIPMMGNYGFLLAIWQLCLYLFFSFWCIF